MDSKYCIGYIDCSQTKIRHIDGKTLEEQRLVVNTGSGPRDLWATKVAHISDKPVELKEVEVWVQHGNQLSVDECMQKVQLKTRIMDVLAREASNTKKRSCCR